MLGLNKIASGGDLNVGGFKLLLWDLQGRQYEAESLTQMVDLSAPGRMWTEEFKYFDGQRIRVYYDSSRRDYLYFVFQDTPYRLSFPGVENEEKLFTEPKPKVEEPAVEGPLPEATDMHGIVAVLQQAGRMLKKVRIRYVKQNGEITGKLMEPYSFKLMQNSGRWAVYGLPEDRTHIEVFYLDRILSCQVSTSDFVPTWPVEVMAVTPA